ncbi:MAG: glutaredoxin domain-containing protein, partial [Pseudomonas caspiana]
MDIIETIKDQIANNTILLYMKGAPNAPQCGFSAKASQALMACGEKFAYVDILQNPEIRANLPKYA